MKNTNVSILTGMAAVMGILLILLLILYRAGLKPLPIRKAESREKFSESDEANQDSPSQFATVMDGRILIFEDRAEDFVRKGQIFTKSVDSRLSEDEIRGLRQAVKTDLEYRMLIRLAVNEIYARHGFPFSEQGPFDRHYRNYDWYLKALEEDKWFEEDLSDTESDNVSLLVKIENEERSKSPGIYGRFEAVRINDTWENACEICTMLGGKLAVIASEEEQKEAARAADLLCSEDIVLSFWASKESSDNWNGIPVALDGEGFWVSVEDNDVMDGFICEYSE